MSKPIPTNQAELAEVFSDQAKVAELLRNGEFKDYVTNYARAINKADVDLSKQVKEETQRVLASYLKENGEDISPFKSFAKGEEKVTRPANRTVFNAKAAGAKVEAEFDGAADFFQTIWHNTERTHEVMAKLNRVRNAFSSGSGGDGGFLVPETLRSELLMLSLEDSIVRPRASVIPMSSPRVLIPSVDSTSNVTTVHGGIQTYWKAEAASLTSSSASFARTALDAHKLTAYTEVPNELLQDAVAFEAFLQRAFPSAITFAEDDAFMHGSGAGEPQGYHNASAAVTVTKESGQAADTIVWENLVKMYARMLPGSLNRAVWVVPPNAFPELATMALSVGTGGSAIWLNNGVAGPPATILGRPVVITEKAPTLGDAGDVTFVDFSYYLIGDRQAMTATSSPHYKFQTDETAYKVVSRVDGRAWLNSAITPKNNGDSLSPFVKLGARA